MASFLRNTLTTPVEFTGTGIHSGVRCAMRVEPAEPGHGIVLRHARTGKSCPATIEFANAEESVRRTVIVGPDGARFEQMEHIMAAIAGAGISDALVIQDGVEPPFMDGGSHDFFRALHAVPRTVSNTPWDPFIIEDAYSLEDEGAVLTAAPAEGSQLTAFLDFPGTVAGAQSYHYVLSAETFGEEIARARTFALARDVEMIRQMGLGKGGTLENTVVFDGERYHNPSLHYPDEPARHKIIDLLGDLALLGAPVIGHVSAWRAGHRSHVKFARYLSQEMTARS